MQKQNFVGRKMTMLREIFILAAFILLIKWDVFKSWYFFIGVSWKQVDFRHL